MTNTETVRAPSIYTAARELAEYTGLSVDDCVEFLVLELANPKVLC